MNDSPIPHFSSHGLARGPQICHNLFFTYRLRQIMKVSSCKHSATNHGSNFTGSASGF
jgi:hypothetical protein